MWHVHGCYWCLAVHGGWLGWSNWSSCSMTCGNGTAYRDRSCTNPAPLHGGRNCTGPSYQIKECFLRHCPVNCKWEEFSNWSACSLSCDGGTQHRMRGFVPALHGGEECLGDLREVKDCNTQACPGERHDS